MDLFTLYFDLYVFVAGVGSGELVILRENYTWVDTISLCKHGKNASVLGMNSEQSLNCCGKSQT